MAPRRIKKNSAAAFATISDQLGELHLALGRSVLILKQTQKALKKSAEFLRVNALQLRDSIRELQKRQRFLFAELVKAGILEPEARR